MLAVLGTDPGQAQYLVHTIQSGPSTMPWLLRKFTCPPLDVNRICSSEGTVYLLAIVLTVLLDAHDDTSGMRVDTAEVFAEHAQKKQRHV